MPRKDATVSVCAVLFSSEFLIVLNAERVYGFDMY